MKRNKKILKRKEKGITLIALVITIIVLLILAGVSIAMLTGENGILTQAQRAKSETEKAQVNETNILKNLEDLVEGKIDSNGCFTESSTINGEEPSSNNPTIPAGFKPINTDTSNWGDGTSAPTEESVNAGLVIEDGQGNQFVWIPVDGINLKYEKHTYATETVDDTDDSVFDTGNGNWPTYHYRNYSDWIDNGGNSGSVSKYGGFYIGRYEAGVPEDANFYAANDGDAYYNNLTNPSKNVTTYIPVSKKDVQVWNYISQENALEVSSKMYNSSSVESSLIDGYAWYTITQWLSNSNYNVTDSRSYGNYFGESFSFNGLYATHVYENNVWEIAANYSKGEHTKLAEERIETATGISERNKVKNIYDLAGNVWEWTTETGKHEGTDNIYAVNRGGSHVDNINGPVSCRGGSGISSDIGFNIGFRVVLYLK